MKLHFNQLFKTQNGTVIPKVRLRINNQTQKPGSNLSSSTILAGIHLDFCIGKYFEVEELSGVFCIKGVYEDTLLDKTAS
ncbi:hypothetical protein GYB22_10190 [bacterium]|nr:hypothetical protein [bacterium]